MGLQIQVLNASTSLELDAAFAALVKSDPTPSSSAAHLSCSTGGSNWLSWRHATRFPQYTKTVIMPKSAD